MALARRPRPLLCPNTFKQGSLLPPAGPLGSAPRARSHRSARGETAPTSLLHMPGRSPGAQLRRTSPPHLSSPQSPLSSPRREDQRRHRSRVLDCSLRLSERSPGGDSPFPIPFCLERRAEARSLRKFLSGREGRCFPFSHTEVGLGPPNPGSHLVRRIFFGSSS